MNIAAHIHALLYTEDCVIIPGLGGFVCNEKPAEFNTILHIAQPKTRNLLFNARLTENDGILVHYIAGREQISYEQAQNSINSAISDLIATLKERKNMAFGVLGTFYWNEEEKLIFIPSYRLNLLKSSYGLPSVKLSQKIPRFETKLQINKGIVLQEKRSNSRKSPKKKRRSPNPTLIFVNILGSVFLLGTIFGLLNFEKDLTRDALIYNQAAMIDISSISSDEPPKPVAQFSKEVKDMLQKYEKSSGKIYHHIVVEGTYNYNEAETLQLKYQTRYPQCRILESENNYLLSLTSFLNENLANEYRTLIQQSSNETLTIIKK